MRTPALEEQFIAEGWALGRHPFAGNDFLLVGPHDDPAHARGCELLAAFQRIADTRATFLTRGCGRGPSMFIGLRQICRQIPLYAQPALQTLRSQLLTLDELTASMALEELHGRRASGSD